MPTLPEQLRRLAKQTDPSKILSKMGYHPIHRSSFHRLTSVLESPVLGLEESHYDYRYSSREFLSALCDALGIPESECNAFIANYDDYEQRRQTAYKPWLWVEVSDEERGRLSGFFTKMAAGSRQIPLPWDTWEYPLEVQLKMAKTLAQQHWESTGGTMGVWGQITGYRLHYSHNRQPIPLNPLRKR